MKKHLLPLIAIAGIASSSLQAQTLQNDWWQPYGGSVSVLDADTSSGTLYLGGNFGYVGPKHLYNARLDRSTGASEPMVRPNGPVHAVIPDGLGGWFIGGAFTEVDGQQRRNVARILSNGSLATWAGPSVFGFGNSDATVYALSLRDGQLYMGGTFTQVGGQSRQKIARLDALTGALDPWAQPSSSVSEVRVIRALTEKVYVGGAFSNMGGQARTNVAVLDAGTGLALDFVANASGSVNALLLNGNTLYLGGSFGEVNGTARLRLAAVNDVTGSLQTWNPGCNNVVQDLLIDNGRLYVCGSFTQVAGQPRQRLASFELPDGDLSDWSPNSTGTILTMASTEGVIYVGGNMGGVQGELRGRIAALDGVTGALLPWNPGASQTVRAMVVVDGKLIIGGDFAATGGVARAGAAAMDLSTGEPLPWAVTIGGGLGNTGNVRAIRHHQGTVYLGGRFDQANGTPCVNLAAFDATTGALLPWNATADSPLDPNVEVLSMDAIGSRLIIGGDFRRVNGADRLGLAALDLVTGELLPWDPCSPPGCYIAQVTARENMVHVGGAFMEISGQTRTHFAVIDPITAQPTPFAPVTDGTVNTFTYLDDTLYVGGTFAQQAGQPRSRLAAFQVSNGALLPWDPAPNGTVFHLTSGQGRILNVGSFTFIGGHVRNRAAELSAAGLGDATAFDPAPGISALRVLAMDSTIFFGGSFSTVQGGAHETLAVFKGCLERAFHRDFDGDGYGDPADMVIGCAPAPPGYVANSNDCDDNDDQVWTGGPCVTSSGAGGLWSGECICTGPTGISGSLDPAALEIFPNPSAGTFQLRVGTPGTITLNVHDMTGRSLHRESMAAPGGWTHTMQLGHLPSGGYLLHMQSDQGIATARLIIE